MISTLRCWQLPDEGKALSPKGLPDAKREDPGAAQKMRRTVIEMMLCCRDERRPFALCVKSTGYFIYSNRRTGDCSYREHPTSLQLMRKKRGTDI